MFYNIFLPVYGFFDQTIHRCVKKSRHDHVNEVTLCHEAAISRYDTTNLELSIKQLGLQTCDASVNDGNTWDTISFIIMNALIYLSHHLGGLGKCVQTVFGTHARTNLSRFMTPSTQLRKKIFLFMFIFNLFFKLSFNLVWERLHGIN